MMIAPRLLSDRELADVVVEARGLSKRFGDRTALHDFSLRIPEESVYLLVGENGAGRTTLIRILLGLMRADGGAAEVLGFDSATRAHVARAHIGFVPERAEVPYDWMTPVALFRHHAAYYDGWNDSYAAELCEAFEVRPRSKLGRLSKGELRRVQLILALAHQPPVLLLDEPTDGLDPVAREQFFAILARHLATTPTTVLLATHHVAEAERLATHVGVLRGGRLRVELRCEEMHRLLRRYRVEVPEPWRGAPALDRAILRREGSAREVRWTIWGDESSVVRLLEREGATVRDVSGVSVHDAALALLTLPNEEEPWALG